jgi:hypothetical protein
MPRPDGTTHCHKRIVTAKQAVYDDPSVPTAGSIPNLRAPASCGVVWSVMVGRAGRIDDGCGTGMIPAIMWCRSHDQSRLPCRSLYLPDTAAHGSGSPPRRRPSTTVTCSTTSPRSPTRHRRGQRHMLAVAVAGADRRQIAYRDRRVGRRRALPGQDPSGVAGLVSDQAARADRRSVDRPSQHASTSIGHHIVTQRDHAIVHAMSRFAAKQRF